MSAKSDELRTSGHLSAIIRRASVGIAELSADGRLSLVNDELCRMLGRSSADLLDLRITDLLPAAELEPFLQALSDVAEGASRRTLEQRSLTPAGEPVWMHCDLTRLEPPGEPPSVLLVATDISDRKRAEQALRATREGSRELVLQQKAERLARRESEERLQFALDAARMGTWSWNPHRDVARLDARAAEILGIEPGTDLTWARAVEKHLAPRNAEKYMECVRRIMEPEGADEHFEVELQWIRHDGRPVWIQMTGRSFFERREGARHVSWMTGTVLDISERKRSEEALAESSRQKDRFLATLAHELRNPLAPLSYAAELLREDSRQELEWSRGVIERQLQHLTRLIDDLLDLSRINRDRLEVRRERIVIGDVIRAAIEASRPTLTQAAQELEVELPPEAILVHGDFVRLTQVFTNLLKNAAKFSIEPGHVRLTVQRDGDRVSVRVRDSGIGMTADELPHVFDMFYQSDSSVGRTHGGLGIGLYLVRRLVELHGGTVEARSDETRRGSEFIVTLPVLADEAAQPPSAAADRSPHAGARRVLIVDDNHDSADALAKLLRGAGHEVFVQYDGAAAVAAAKRFRPDVVLLDLGMPTIDGFEVCRRIRRHPWGAHMRLVALTGWGRREDRARTGAAGFDAHLVKPVSLAAVESILRRGLPVD